MRTVEIKTAPAYSVHIGSGLLAQCGTFIARVHAPCLAVLVTDSFVDMIYSSSVVYSLKEAGYRVEKFVIPSGEKSKTMQTYMKLLSFLAELRVTRSDLIVALGGGVVGDLTGFAAATYLRGMDFIQLPTSFLAQVDSSVGGKTAVDLPQGKNLVGAFWQPRLVLCDIKCLATLSMETLADGLGETIKYGMIADAEILRILQGDGLRDEAENVISRCVKIKADVVEADERDNGPRQLLNFGHTAGHAIEKHSHFTLTHGRAVAIGMAVVTRACVKRGMVDRSVLDVLESLLKKNGLSDRCTLSAAELARGALADKKRRGENITLVVPASLGKCVLSPIPTADLEAFFRDGL